MADQFSILFSFAYLYRLVTTIVNENKRRCLERPDFVNPVIKRHNRVPHIKIDKAAASIRFDVLLALLINVIFYIFTLCIFIFTF